MRKLGLSVVASLDQGDTINQWHSRFNPWSPGSEPRALPNGPAKSTTVHPWPWSGVSLEKKAWMSPRPADSEPGSWERCLGKVAGGAAGPGDRKRTFKTRPPNGCLPAGQVSVPSPDLGSLDSHLFREPPKSRQAMAFFMSVPPKMEGAMLLEMTS